MSIYQAFWASFNKEDHQALGRWALACAEQVLPLFEATYPQDHRPREALAALSQWIQTGEFKMRVIRKAALDAHAAAREVKKTDAAACFVARACGQAAGTAHVPAHALGALHYALKALRAATPENAEATVDKARAWHLEHLSQPLQGYLQQVMEAKKMSKI